jgi:hypothetical protein
VRLELTTYALRKRRSAAASAVSEGSCGNHESVVAGMVAVETPADVCDSVTTPETRPPSLDQDSQDSDANFLSAVQTILTLPLSDDRLLPLMDS